MKRFEEENFAQSNRTAYLTNGIYENEGILVQNTLRCYKNYPELNKLLPTNIFRKKKLFCFQLQKEKMIYFVGSKIYVLYL